LRITMRDKVILVVTAALLCAWGEYNMILEPMQKKIVTLQKEKEAAKGLLTDITPLVEESEKLKIKENQLKNSIETIKTSDVGKTMTNEEFLVFIGDSTSKNNVNVTGFNNLGLTTENGIYKMIIDMELKGNSADINKVLTDIDNMGIKYSVGSLSFRQDEQYDYLKRFYDDLTDLPWYEEPDEEEIEEFKKENEDDSRDDSSTENEDISAPDIYYPDFSPYPDSSVPEYVPSTPSPTPEPDVPKSIDERIDRLLEMTSFKIRSNNYEIKLLTNNDYSYKDGQNMRLAITMCLIMFDEPGLESTVIYETETDEHGTL